MRTLFLALMMSFLSHSAFGAAEGGGAEDRAASYTNLNHDLLRGVFAFLNNKDLCRASQTNSFNNLAAKYVAPERQSQIVLDKIIQQIIERQALEALFRSTDGANWHRNTNWMSDAPIGEWYGVTVKEGRVVELNLYDNLLSGHIPAELGQLTALQKLNLHKNFLSGLIPAELGQLGALVCLSLFENLLSGHIPEELGNLRALRNLFLHKNNLSGSIPAEFGQLRDLTRLGLSNNQLTGPTPAELMKFEQNIRLGNNLD